MKPVVDVDSESPNEGHIDKSPCGPSADSEGKSQSLNIRDSTKAVHDEYHRSPWTKRNTRITKDIVWCKGHIRHDLAEAHADEQKIMYEKVSIFTPHWRDLPWWTAIMFGGGCILFVVAASIQCAASLTNNIEAQIWGVAVPYFVGSTMFVVGIGAMLFDCATTMNTLVHTRGNWTSQRHHMLEVLGTFVLAVGVLLYQVMVMAALISLYIDFSATLNLWLLDITVFAGGVCFTVSAYILFAEEERSWFLLRPRDTEIIMDDLEDDLEHKEEKTKKQRKKQVKLALRSCFSMSWWIQMTNLIGSALFFFGSFHIQDCVNLLTCNWVPIFFGFVIGSACFVVQAYLMLVHITNGERIA